MTTEKKDNSPISLVERAFALPDSNKEYGMKRADHELICSVLDANNAQFTQKLLADVVEVIGQELRPFKEQNEKEHKALKAQNEALGVQIDAIDRRTNDRKVWTIRILVAVVTILLAVLLAFILFIGYHNKYLTTGNKFKFFNSEWTVERQLQIRTAPVRSIHYNKLTEAQKDSIITENQEGILRSIEQRTKEYNEKYKK